MSQPLRVLISAYACEPHKGSEPEVGLQAVLAAASRYEVWVMTRSNNVTALQDLLSALETAHPIHVIGIDLSNRAQRMKRSTGRIGFYWYYDRWQTLAGATAEKLHAQVGFHLVHHATIATYWQQAVTGVLRIPSVLGPVGGGPTTPRRLIFELGPRGIATDLLRTSAQRLWSSRRAVHRSLTHASVVLAQNPETVSRIAPYNRAIVAPNGSAASISDAISPTPANEIIVAGRLIPYKAGALALRAFAQAEQPETRLVFIGDGPERSRLERLAASMDLGQSVEFLGWLPRRAALERIAGAKALLHPALHEDSGMTVAEALTLGTPVICLDIGGPPVLCALWPDELSEVVTPTTRAGTTQALALAISRVTMRAPVRIPTPIRPSQTFAEQILEAYSSALSSV